MKYINYKGLSKILLGISICFFISIKNNAQSFVKKNKYIDIGLGIGIQNMNLQVKENVYQWKTDNAVLPFRFEYAILNQIGLGFIYKRNLYIMNTPGINTRKSSNSNSLMFTNNVHVINTKQFDFSISIQYGLGYLKQNLNYQNINRTMLGSGINYGLDFIFRISHSDNLSLFCCFTFNNYSYDLINYAENGERFNLKGQNRSVNIIGSELSTGITYLLKKQT